jgi:hypothetical protein
MYDSLEDKTHPNPLNFLETRAFLYSGPDLFPTIFFPHNSLKYLDQSHTRCTRQEVLCAYSTLKMVPVNKVKEGCL